MNRRPTTGGGSPGDLGRQVREVRILQRISADINASLDPERIYRAALETMGELFGFDHCLILLLGQNGDELEVVASRGYEGQAIGGRIPVGVGVPGVVAKKRRAMHLNNLRQRRAYVSAQRRRMVEEGRGGEVGERVPVPGLPDAESQIAVPLMVGPDLIGVFSVESSVPRGFEEHERDLVMIVSNQTAAAIHAARSYQALARANEELERRVAERTAELEHRLEVAEEFLSHARGRVDGALLGESSAARRLREAIATQAASNEVLLLAGPAGAGKEAIARAIHAESPRRRGPFIHVDGGRLDSGERKRTPGRTPVDGDARLREKLDLADGGTLYIDAFNALPRGEQQVLLERISGWRRARAEGREPAPDVRIIAAATRDLFHEVHAAGFDVGLYRILNENRLLVPPLIDRAEDIPVLVEHFVRKHARRLGKTIEGVTEGSMERLLGYGWPGNVRELENVVERAVLVARGLVLEIGAEMLGGITVGSYRLAERIGSGGMGEVWRAEHQLLARPAAVKLIRSQILDRAEADRLAERFEREARVTAGLRSPHTVQLYDFGIGEGGSFYYVMELLSGMDVNEAVVRHGPMPVERVVMLLRQACRSLSEAHDLGLVHRDIKPANLYVTNLGREYDFLKVLDFGIVKIERLDERTPVTRENAFAGTPAFMAPELATGEGKIDGRADLYSLGCVAFWMLTGLLVFEAENVGRMIVQHLRTPPRRPSEVSETEIPAELDAIVLRCLEKDPALRPVDAGELEEALEQVRCETPWTSGRAREWWRRHAPGALQERSPLG